MNYTRNGAKLLKESTKALLRSQGLCLSIEPSSGRVNPRMRCETLWVGTDVHIPNAVRLKQRLGHTSYANFANDYLNNTEINTNVFHYCGITMPSLNVFEVVPADEVWSHQAQGAMFIGNEYVVDTYGDDIRAVAENDKQFDALIYDKALSIFKAEIALYNQWLHDSLWNVTVRTLDKTISETVKAGRVKNGLLDSDAKQAIEQVIAQRDGG